MDDGAERPLITSEPLTERESALFVRTRHETLVEIRDEFDAYERRRPSPWWADRSRKGHARWATRVLEDAIGRLERISGPPPPLPPLEEPVNEARP